MQIFIERRWAETSKTRGILGQGRSLWLVFASVPFLLLLAGLPWRALAEAPVEILNASYDPTRELWRDLNEAFRAQYETQSGKKLVLRQSHGGSASQARAVIDGLLADVVSLALWPDVDALRGAGLLAEGWEKRLPNGSVPYWSTIVFVVRTGNPKGIRDWPDLVRPGIQVITPNPKTSGNGRLSLLAAWGATRLRGGSEPEATEFLAKLYRNVPVLDTGARGATMTFVQRQIGDVHLTWENEAYLEVQEAGGTVEIVYPPLSILAEPPVAWVDRVVERKGTQEVAAAYLRFLFTPQAQEIVARHFYRPIDDAVRQRYASRFPALRLFRVQEVVANWEEAQRKFFAEGALFDRIVAGDSQGGRP